MLRAQDFNQIAAILHSDAGIHLPETKTSLVYSRLAKRLRALGLTSFREYCALITAHEGADERQQMIAALDHQRHPLLPRAAPFRASEAR